MLRSFTTLLNYNYVLYFKSLNVSARSYNIQLRQQCNFKRANKYTALRRVIYKKLNLH